VLSMTIELEQLVLSMTVVLEQLVPSMSFELEQLVLSTSFVLVLSMTIELEQLVLSMTIVLEQLVPSMSFELEQLALMSRNLLAIELIPVRFLTMVRRLFVELVLLIEFLVLLAVAVAVDQILTRFSIDFHIEVYTVGVCSVFRLRPMKRTPKR